ncbi:MAG: hypothetical protein WC891_07585 [Actinomycetota bacterium]
MTRKIYDFKPEAGMTTVEVIGIIALIITLMTTSILLVQTTRRGIIHSSDREKAVNIAESGVNDYLWRLNKDRLYYLNFIHPAQGKDALGADKWVDFGEGQYHLEIAPPSGNVPAITVTATGRVKGSTGAYVSRKITALIRKKAFTNYIYMTDYEIVEGTNSVIWWVTGDIIMGPLHTNDNLHTDGTPHFMREVTMTGVLDARNGTPTFDQGYTEHAAALDFPPTNLELKSLALQGGYYYYGQTTITLVGSSLTIANSDTSGKTKGPVGTVSFPTNGVVYVDGLASAKYTANNGDVYISGTYSGGLTVGAKNIIYVTADVLNGDLVNGILGLVADNYVYINHYNRTGVDVAPFDVRIDAAIAAVNHSFGFERYSEGNQRGTITLKGSICQRYRGPVGTFSATRRTGYYKKYEFDERMAYLAPPHFIEPANAGFEIIKWLESAP